MNTTRLVLLHVRGVSEDWLVLQVADHVSLRHGLVGMRVDHGRFDERLDRVAVAVVLALAVTLVLVLVEGRVT